jgi:heme O synthase-like polyprenyltransferase
MIAFGVQVHREQEVKRMERAAHRLFGFSIVYLFVLFATMIMGGWAAHEP